MSVPDGLNLILDRERPFLIRKLFTCTIKATGREPGLNCHMHYDLSCSYLKRFDVMLFEGAMNQSVAALGGIR